MLLLSKTSFQHEYKVVFSINFLTSTIKS